MKLAPTVKTVLSATGFYRARLRARSYAGVAALAYHGVRPDAFPSGGMCFEPLHVTASRLDEHCRVLRDLCRVLTFDEWRRIAEGSMPTPARAALVTFDDGYRTVLTEALPILERHGIPAVVFVCTDPIARRRRFWFDAVARRSGEAAVERAKELPWQEWRALVAGHDEPISEDDPMAPLTVDELRTLASNPLVAIGAHSVTHPILSRAPLDVQEAELRESRAILESWIGRPVTAFAYPNGRPGVDYTADTMRALAACGFEHAFAVGDAFARLDMSRFEQHRFLMMDTITGPELAHRLALSWRRPARAS